MKQFITILFILTILNPLFSNEIVKTISVVGQSDITIKPDTVVISTGVDSGDPVIGIALEENKIVMNNIFEGLADLGIEKSNIETSDYNVYLHVPYNQPENEEYRVSNSIKINISNIDLVDAVIDTLITCGANKVNGVYFTFQNKEKYTKELSKKAMLNAREKAEFLADLENMKVFSVISIEEDQYNNKIENRNFAYEMSESRMNSNISSGMETLTIKYNVVYQIISK